jgi:hypothetical protein
MNQNAPQAPYSSSSASSAPVNINHNFNNNTEHVVHNNMQLSKSKILVLLAALLFLVIAVGFCGGLAGSVIMISKDDCSGSVAAAQDNASHISSDDGSDDLPSSPLYYESDHHHHHHRHSHCGSITNESSCLAATTVDQKTRNSTLSLVRRSRMEELHFQST